MSHPEFVLTLFTDRPELAAAADRAGVQRIGVDLESLDKAERQRGLGMRLSEHELPALARLSPVLEQAELFARIDPINPASAAEIAEVLAHEVRVIMLPYYHRLADVDTFLDLTAGACTTVLLAETRAALAIMPAVLARGGFDEIHFGLGDLAIELGTADRFEVLARPEFIRALDQVRNAGIPFGIGGVARVDDRSLPTDPQAWCETIVRAGASRAVVARSFLREADPTTRLTADVAALQASVEQIRTVGTAVRDRA